MKRFFILVAVIALIFNLAQAQKGIYIEQKNHTKGVMGQPDKDQINKTYILGEKMRVESGSSVTIMRADKKIMWNIMTDQKQYMEMTFEQMDQMASMGMSMLKGKKELDFTFKKTDATKKIKNWNCYEVIVESQMMKQKMWLTEDLPYNKEDFYKFYSNMPRAKKLAESFFKAKELKGYPVYTETEMNMMGMKIESTSELISIEKKSMSGEIFELPQGYTKMDNPMFQMQKK